MTDHVLYRCYSEGDRLLYVGITMTPPARFASHRQSGLWWSQVSFIKLETFNSRSDLEIAERIAIETESPLYNVKHSRYNPNWIDYWDYCHECDHYTGDKWHDTRTIPYDMYISDADGRIFAEFRCLKGHEFWCTFDLTCPIASTLRHEWAI